MAGFGGVCAFVLLLCFVSVCFRHGFTIHFMYLFVCLLFIFNCMYLGVLLTGIALHQHVWGPKEPEVGIGSSGTVVTDAYGITQAH